MKKILFIGAILLSPILAGSQDWYGAVALTYSTNSMNELKTLQNDYLMYRGFPGYILTSFPPYWGGGIEAGRMLKNGASVGMTISYTSTGGRIYYEDYSGVISMDQLLSAYSIAPYYQIKLNKSTVWPLYASLSLTWVHTTMTLIQTTTISGQNTYNEDVLQSNNFGLKPSLVVRRNLGQFFAQASIGYEVQMTGKLYVEDSDAYLITASGDPATAQWSGLRMSLGVGFFLNGSKKPEQTKQ